MGKLVLGTLIVFLLLINIVMSTGTIKVRAATLIVPDEFPTFQTAIDAAESGDTILIRTGVYYENITINKPLTLTGESINSAVLNGTANEYVMHITSDNVTVRKLTVASNCQYPDTTSIGIYIDKCRHCSIVNNTISTGGVGISLYNADCNVIMYNRIVEIEEMHRYGIILISSSDNLLVGNLIANSDSALVISAGHDNSIISNDLQSTGTCVDFVGTEDCLLAKNSIAGFWGLSVGNSNGTIVYHNNLFGSWQPPVSDASAGISVSTVWDAGYPLAGNFWVGYEGLDVYSGPYQNETGADGMIDTPFAPYSGDENCSDHYPLAQPYALGQHDIGIALCSLSKTVVARNNSLIARVGIMNYGRQTETFNFTYQANSSTIEKEILTLESGEFSTRASSWNTSDFEFGYYAIRLSLGVVFGELDLVDNVLEGFSVYVGITGDINADGKVDMKDLGNAARGFMTTPGDPFWNANADLDNNDKIDMKDIGTIARHFMEHYP